MENIKLGIIRETKDPPDRRVPFTPGHCRILTGRYPGLQILVQPSPNRCFTDEEYRREGIALSEDLTGCDLLAGVKEVKSETLIEGKTYLFFSHTAKKQPYNRGLLRAVVRKGIRLVDYEYLTGEDGNRVVAFGRWAGIVGAYNGLRAWGLRNNTFELSPPHRCHDLDALKDELVRVNPGRSRIALTGGGRVAGGAEEVLTAAGIRKIDPGEYLQRTYKESVYTRLEPWHYAKRKDGSSFDFPHFVEFPHLYENSFIPYAGRTDLYIACHFWDPASPLLLTRKDLSSAQIPIRVVADISCDINGPIASTIRASTIAEPFYGYDPETGGETAPFRPGAITVMAVDNLPGELPRDASADFGDALVEHVIPELVGSRNTGMVDRATITMKGALNAPYAYLTDFLEGKE